MTSPIEAVDQLNDHWWWRPGWRQGRLFYACHLTVDQWPQVQRLAATYQQALAGLDGLDLIPAQWLHLTMRGIGFVDEVPARSIDRVVAALTERLADHPAPQVTFHRPVVRPEAVYLPATPAEPLVELEAVVRESVGSVLGDDWLTSLAQDAPPYRPHVSVAYSNRSQPSAGIVDALAEVAAEPAPVTVRHVSMLNFHRDRRMYEWTKERRTFVGEPSP